METHYVFCEMRAQFLNIMVFNFMLGSLKANFKVQSFNCNELVYVNISSDIWLLLTAGRSFKVWLQDTTHKLNMSVCCYSWVKKWYYDIGYWQATWFMW